ncbi:MAG TPA: permease prefix domain 1-containing protein [Galbitalea sp.]|jgi:ABC-type glycerol-3-phosphate transport system permease component|nr:permease prefix domain 1-containing protein [Galbitalea sp.]
MSTDITNIHRYLDDAFADLPRTPENQDLKEEIRGNLASRVAELESAGAKPDAAAAKAIKELGPISELIDPAAQKTEAAPQKRDAPATAAKLIQLNRVRISPAYVVRTVLLALLLATGATLVTVGAILGAQHIAPTWLVYFMPTEAIASGAFLGMIVADALARETSQHYAMPARRALGFGLAAFAGLAGLGLVATWFANSLVGLLIAGCILVLASLMAFIALGVTQTNRTKAWVKDLNHLYSFPDGFTEDPASAARFGLYTVVIWVVAIAAFIVLSITVGFAWSWLALVAALVIFFVVLARMLFPAGASSSNNRNDHK